jgi:hypothetical protein
LSVLTLQVPPPPLGGWSSCPRTDQKLAAARHFHLEVDTNCFDSFSSGCDSCKVVAPMKKFVRLASLHLFLSRFVQETQGKVTQVSTSTQTSLSIAAQTQTSPYVSNAPPVCLPGDFRGRYSIYRTVDSSCDVHFLVTAWSSQRAELPLPPGKAQTYVAPLPRSFSVIWLQ